MKAALSILLVLAATTAWGKEPAKKAPAEAPKDKVLWNTWYIVKAGGNVDGYYSEEVEHREGEKQISVNQHWWERNFPLGIKETLIGSVSGDGKGLPPTAFYVEKKSELGSTSNEGRIQGRTLTVTLKPKGDKISTSLSKGTILSSALGLLMAEQGRNNNRKEVTFTAVLEDAPDNKTFTAQKGSFKLLSESETIRGETCYAAETKFQGVAGKWWLSKEGKLCRMVIPSANVRIDLADESEAKASLKP